MFRSHASQSSKTAAGRHESVMETSFTMFFLFIYLMSVRIRYEKMRAMDLACCVPITLLPQHIT
jgi:hypothetical protein